MYKKMFLSIVFLSLCLVFMSIDLIYAQDTTKAGEENITPLALTTGKGWLEKAKFYAENAEVSNNSSTTWVDAFNTFVAMKDTTAASQCLEIRYSGECAVSGSTGNPYILLRALVDGNPAEGNGIVWVPFLMPLFNQYTICNYSWWECGLAANLTTHTINIQFMPYVAGNTAYVRQRTLILEYKR